MSNMLPPTFLTDWQGDYATPRIALESRGIPVTVTNSRFATRNANALRVNDAVLRVSASQFIACGAPQYFAGAIVHSDNTRDIQHCRFEECVGSHAGALHVANLRGVADCEFIACRSTAIKDVTNLAIYAVKGPPGSSAVRACIFRQCSLSIGHAGSSDSRSFVINSQFHNGNLYFSRNNGNSIGVGCTFTGGQVIEKEL